MVEALRNLYAVSLDHNTLLFRWSPQFTPSKLVSVGYRYLCWRGCMIMMSTMRKDLYSVVKHYLLKTGDLMARYCCASILTRNNAIDTYPDILFMQH